MGSDKASECGWRQQSLPYHLMWLLAVSLTASSPLIYTTAATCNPNKPQTTNYVRSALSKAYQHEKEKERECFPQEVHFSAVYLQTV